MNHSASLNGLVRELRSFDTPSARFETTLGSNAPAILDAFLRFSGARAGALYRHGGSGLELVGARGQEHLPEWLPTPDSLITLRRSECAPEAFPALPSQFDIMVPLTHGPEMFGLLALAGPDADVDALEGATSYFSALLRSQRMGGEVREGELQLKYRLLELESLYDIGLSIASTLNLDELAEEILVRTMSLLDARSAALFLRRGDHFELYRAFGTVRGQMLESELNDELRRDLVESERVLHINENADCVFPGCQSFVALPVKSNRGVVGVLAAADRELRDGGIGTFSENDIRLLSQFATQAAIALDNARLHQDALEKQVMERELALAAMIQRDILPREVPVWDGLEIATLAIPARQLGGDYHTFWDAGDGALGFCLADVSGKSVPAAILVSALHAALQLLVSEDRDLGEIATELNTHIHRWSSENKFATLVLAIVDRDAELVRYVNAGHNPAYVLHDGRLSTIDSNGLPIGLLAQSRYSVQTIPFRPGSLLAVYSDGISEAENLTDEEFGNDRLEELLLQGERTPLRELASRIEHAVHEFEAGAPQKDDQTLVLVRGV